MKKIINKESPICSSTAIILTMLLLITLKPTKLWAQPIDLDIVITNIKTTGDTLRVLLWSGPSGFPREKEYCLKKQSAQVTSDTVVITFMGLNSDYYAVSCFYDENNNRKYDRSLWHQTAEPFGLSGNPDYKHLPVHYKDARFFISADNHRIHIRLHYKEEARSLLNR